MKITSFQPMIITQGKNAENVKAVFEALGFEQRHHKQGLGDGTASDFVMKNEDGFKVDIVSYDNFPKDMMTIRMNVDNLEEAMDKLAGFGFTSMSGKINHSKNSKGCTMVSPTGFTISLSEHEKQ